MPPANCTTSGSQLFEQSVGLFVDGVYEPRARQLRDALFDSANVVRLACEVIDGLCASAGASAYFQSSPLQRALRDVQMMRGHVVFDWDRAAQIGGKIRLGLPSAPADML